MEEEHADEPGDLMEGLLGEVYWPIKSPAV